MKTPDETIEETDILADLAGKAFAEIQDIANMPCRCTGNARFKIIGAAQNLWKYAFRQGKAKAETQALQEAEAREAVLVEALGEAFSEIDYLITEGIVHSPQRDKLKDIAQLLDNALSSTRSKQLLDLVEAAVGYTSKTFGCACADEIILYIMKGCQCGFQALSETAKPFIKKEGV